MSTRANLTIQAVLVLFFGTAVYLTLAPVHGFSAAEFAGSLVLFWSACLAARHLPGPMPWLLLLPFGLRLTTYFSLPFDRWGALGLLVVTAIVYSTTIVVRSRQSQPAKSTRPRPYLAILHGCLCVLVGLVYLPPKGKDYHDVPLAFAGESSDLRKTIVLPTLQSPFDPEKNAVWCATAQLAWNELESVVGEPILLTTGQDVADLMNGSEIDSDTVPQGSSFVAGGIATREFLAETDTKMFQSFGVHPLLPPAVKPPDLPGLVGYGYLRAKVRFTNPFFEGIRPFHFRDAKGSSSGPLHSFGLFKEHAKGFDAVRDQVTILFREFEVVSDDIEMTQCAIDLCKDSTPSQLILAMVPPQETLESTVGDLLAKIRKGDNSGSLHGELIVPAVYFDVTHQFAELSNGMNFLRNPGREEYSFGSLVQTLQFKLDRSGADLESQGVGWVLKAGRGVDLSFDRPFLILLRRRDRDLPYFVLWVANEELLCKSSIPGPPEKEDKKF